MGNGDGRDLALRANLWSNFEHRYLRNRKSEPYRVYNQIAQNFKGYPISNGKCFEVARCRVREFVVTGQDLGYGLWHLVGNDRYHHPRDSL